ncbi:MAG: ASCH domain-containing protein [Candidatus Aenigmatarchaeota archaeon]
MKQLKFSDPLPKLILEGRKTATWRLNDEKNIQAGDELALYYNDGREFARAVVTRTKETTFGQLTEEDRAGHEPFPSDQEMYGVFSRYYRTQVGPGTRVKVIKFRVL